MSFNISININLRNNSNITYLENLIHDAAINCNNTNSFEDFELEGINKHIKKNIKAIILEFDYIDDICSFIKFIKFIKELTIEYIYNENNILYCTNNYLNNIDPNLHSKTELINIIEKNKNLNKFKKIYNCLL